MKISLSKTLIGAAIAITHSTGAIAAGYSFGMLSEAHRSAFGSSVLGSGSSANNEDT